MPVLLEQIPKYAALEQSNQLPDVSQDKLFESYAILKDIFAEQYVLTALESKYFTWQIFSDLLAAHSFTGVEILFIPVLREVMHYFFSIKDEVDERWIAHEAKTAGGQRSLSNFQSKDILSFGRYHFLEYSYVNLFFNYRFGISGLAHTYMNETQSYHGTNDVIVDERKPPDGAKIIHVYFKGFHYELNEHEKLETARAISDRERENLGGLAAIQAGFEKCSESASNEAIAKLRIYGKQKINQIMIKSAQITAAERKQLLVELQPNVALIEATASKVEEPSRFYFNCMVGLALSGAGVLLLLILINPMISMPFSIALSALGTASLLGSASMFFARSAKPDDAPDSPEFSFI